MGIEFLLVWKMRSCFELVLKRLAASRSCVLRIDCGLCLKVVLSLHGA